MPTIYDFTSDVGEFRTSWSTRLAYRVTSNLLSKAFAPRYEIVPANATPPLVSRSCNQAASFSCTLAHAAAGFGMSHALYSSDDVLIRPMYDAATKANPPKANRPPQLRAFLASTVCRWYSGTALPPCVYSPCSSIASSKLLSSCSFFFSFGCFGSSTVSTSP